MNGGNKALIIENTPALLEWLANAISDNGMEVTACTNAFDALARIAEGFAPDLIVADIESVQESERRLFCDIVYSEQSSAEGGTTVLAISHGRRQINPDYVIHAFAARGLLTLPCTESMLVNMANTLIESHHLSRKPLVLIVDDSEELRALIRSALSVHAFRVIEAGCGLDAVHMATERRPDIIILDHILPDANGLSITPHLKAHGDPLLIVITGDASPSLASDYSKVGAHAFIRKPFSVGYLAEVVRKSHRDWVLPPLSENDLYCRAAVRAAQNPYHELFAAMSVACAILTPEENGADFIFRDINPSALALTKLSRENALGNSISDLFPAAEESGVPETLRQVMRTRRSVKNRPCEYDDGRIQGGMIYDVYHLKTGELAVLARTG